MEFIYESFFYVLIFISVYVQVFLLLTFLENRKKIVTRKGPVSLKRHGSVTIVVPCWNEENTVRKTVESLLALNYPKDKLSIMLIDDGSEDNTFKVINEFAHIQNVEVIQKKNGGKYSVLNLGLERSNTEFFGCLDADSVVDSEALVRIMSQFEHDPNSMAVVPSVNVIGAGNVIQNAQVAEYHMGVYMKKMLDFLGAINVTPGPFTIFRKKVFEDLGPYRHAHNTEDMEIAYRMQVNDYKITHCYDAYVFTNTPATITRLYKQRLRWIYGFINNTLDYRRVILKKKYGNFALFTLPTGVVSMVAVGYLFIRIVSSLASFIDSKLTQFQAVGFSAPSSISSFDPFFMSMETSFFLVLFVYSGVAFGIMFGQKMSQGHFRPSMKMIYFFVLFRIVAPFWILKAIYNTIIKRQAPSWR